MPVRTRFKDFLQKFISRGGDVTRLSYDLGPTVRKEYTRRILSIHSGGVVKVKSQIKESYVVNEVFMETCRTIDLASFKPVTFPCRSERTSTVLLFPRGE